MTFWLRATGPALVSWPVLVLVAVWSAVLSLLGSGSTATGSLAVRATIAFVAGIAATVVVLLVWWLVLRRVGGLPHVVVAMGAVVAAGAVRGLVVQAGFVEMDFSEGSASDYIQRIVPSIFTISFAFLVGASGVAAVTSYRQTAGQLLAEQQRLVSLIDSSAVGIEERQTDALDRVQKRLDAELRGLALDTAPSAVEALESLAGDVVRPLSHSLAHELPQWDAEVPRQAPRVRLIDVLRDPVPSAAIQPLVLPLALLIIALPAGALVYQPRIGLATVIVGLFVLLGTLALGRLWLVRHPPHRPVLVWLEIVLILAIAAVLTSRAASLVDRSDPSAGAIPSLAIFVVPVFGLIIAMASMMGARMRDITIELESTTRQLQWSLARVNTQQWEQSGRLSRALHGPVQSLLHARLMWLRRQLEDGEVTSTELDELRVDLQRALASALSPSEAPRAVSEVLNDVTETWDGVAAVSCYVSPPAEEHLAADPLCTHALTDLATEAVSNAVRHGKATTVFVTIDVDEDELIRLSVVDDGRVPEQGMPGLGTALLTRCTYDWSLTHNPTTLTARLPCVMAPATTATSVSG